MERNERLIKDLLTLSDIFKDGFIIKYDNGSINQYNDYRYPYIVSYKTIIKRNINHIMFDVNNIPDRCIIGGWFDIDNDIYYIELNYAFDSLVVARMCARVYKQRYIFNIKTGRCIKT